MRVFISWSGEQSHDVALVLKEWLPTVVQALDTWVSSADIEKGETWFTSITESLVKADGMGVFCLTQDNLQAPWLAYEAGVLASQDRGRVATFLHKVNAAAVKAPLGLFQATKGDSKADIYRLVTLLNGRTPSPLAEHRLTRAFETNWQSLEEQLQAIKSVVLPASPSTDISQMLEEIMNSVKRIEKDTSFRSVTSHGSLGLGSLPDMFDVSQENINSVLRNTAGGLLAVAPQPDNPAANLKKQMELKKLLERFGENNGLRTDAKGRRRRPNPKQGG